MQGQADFVAWGKGRVEGTAGFGVRRGAERMTLFFVTTKGNVWVGMGSINKLAPVEKTRAFHAFLRSVGVDAPEELLKTGSWPTFAAAKLSGPGLTGQFEAHILDFAGAAGTSSLQPPPPPATGR